MGREPQSAHLLTQRQASSNLSLSPPLADIIFLVVFFTTLTPLKGSSAR
jgi:hypothetical protein